MELYNLTPLGAKHVVAADRSGRDLLVVVVKATYDLLGRTETALPLAAEQVPVQLADAYLGEPGQSSLAAASDLVPEKPGADVVLTGHIRAPRGGTTQLDVGLRVAQIHRQVRVSGDRVWEKGLTGYRPSAPAPFVKIPLVHERCFGGTDPTMGGRFEANPVGCGFIGPRSRQRLEGRPVPNFEDPRAPIRAPGPTGHTVGFGFIPPSWLQRRRFAGTYDAAWEAEVSPFLPDDFDPRFFCAAPAQQILPRWIAGGERVEVTGLGPRRDLDFAIPVGAPSVRVLLGGRIESLVVACDTLEIDLDRSHLRLVYRARIDVQDRLDELEWVRIASGEQEPT